MSSIIHCVPSSAKQIGAAGCSNASPSPRRKTTHGTENTTSHLPTNQGASLSPLEEHQQHPQGCWHPPGLEGDVAVEHPAVLELHGLGGGGQVVGRRGWRVDLVPPVGERVPVEGVGRGMVMGQGMVVRRRERWPQR